MPDRERTIIGKFSHALAEGTRKVVRGHSDNDVETAQRLASGDIQHEDRERFKTDQLRALGILSTHAPRAVGETPCTGLDVSFTAAGESILVRQEITSLPDDIIDQRLQTDATTNLRKWNRSTKSNT